MQIASTLGFRIGVTAALIVIAVSVTTLVKDIQAQAPAQIGANAPLPVFVTNTVGAAPLPEGFTQGSHWRFTTWTVPSVVTWTATVNKTSGAWANLTINTEDRSNHTRWYFIPSMPGSWERQ